MKRRRNRKAPPVQRLFSPWRSKYIETFSSPENKGDECVLCAAAASHKDDEEQIVARGERCFVIMNRFPYNSGHLLVVPYRHTPSLSDLTEAESLEVMVHLKKMTAVLLSVSRPDGFNVGCNIGRTAGAGIDRHVHFHIVPRWNGDTNFLPVLADTKVISEDMHATLFKLRKALSSLA